MITQTSLTGDDKALINLETIIDRFPAAKDDIPYFVKKCLQELYEPFHRISPDRQQELVQAVHKIISLDRKRRKISEKDRERAKFGF